MDRNQFYQAIIGRRRQRQRVRQISHPHLRYVQQVLAYTIFGRGETATVFFGTETFVLFCILRGIQPHFGFFLASHFYHVIKVDKEHGDTSLGGMVTKIALGLHLDPTSHPDVVIPGPITVDITRLLKGNFISRSPVSDSTYYHVGYANESVTLPLAEHRRLVPEDQRTWVLRFSSSETAPTSATPEVQLPPFSTDVPVQVPGATGAGATMPSSVLSLGARLRQQRAGASSSSAPPPTGAASAETTALLLSMMEQMQRQLTEQIRELGSEMHREMRELRDHVDGRLTDMSLRLTDMQDQLDEMDESVYISSYQVGQMHSSRARRAGLELGIPPRPPRVRRSQSSTAQPTPPPAQPTPPPSQPASPPAQPAAQSAEIAVDPVIPVEEPADQPMEEAPADDPADPVHDEPQD